MSWLVVLRLGKGSWQQGFPDVTVQIGEDDNPRQMQLTASLPPAPDLPRLYRNWQLFYTALYERLGWRLRITFNETEATVTNVSEAEFHNICQQLKTRFNTWLRSEEFHPISKKLWQELAKKDQEIRLLIETDDVQVRQFPWHLWDLFEDYPKSEMALSISNYELVRYPAQKTPGKVRILSVFGNSQGIDRDRDRTVLKHLPGAEVKFPTERSRRTISDELWRHRWDIFFFAGHSSTRIEQGRMELDDTQSLTIDDLHNALRHAIAQGLQLAIFNSCDGLGLANQLAALHLPQSIVMREPIPDRVAGAFLTYFLEAFARGKSFYLAVREARERLQALEDEFPCASWLPVIGQNPAAVPPTWQSLRRIERHRLRVALCASLASTFLIVGLRSLSLLQGLELKAFDGLVRLRPAEQPDPRLLVVGATEEDLNQYGFPLPDGILARAIAKLEPHQPRIIGLDIHRPQVKDKNLIAQMRQNRRLIAVCKVSEGEDLGIPPLPGIPDQRLGFSDIVNDFDGITRRHLLSLTPTPDSACSTQFSFSLRLALHYLAAEGIESPPAEVLQLKNIVFRKLPSTTGGYAKLDSRGYQILLNYRFPNVSQQVSLTQILSGQFESNWVKNRIVLIGVTAPSAKDLFFTPYSEGGQSYQQMSGVIIHAQMTSQILSAVLDRRPLLWVWSPIIEMLWIGVWSLVGGLLFWRCSPMLFLVAGGAAIIALSGICFVFLLLGGWIPLIPAALALIATGGILAAYNAYQNRQQQ
jgi:CHASE2 domain-containing sensor protein